MTVVLLTQHQELTPWCCCKLCSLGVFRPMGWASIEMASHDGLATRLFPSQSCFSLTLQISNRRANHKVPRLHAEPGTIHIWLRAERWQDFLAPVVFPWWPTARLPVRLDYQTLLLFCGGGSSPCHTQAHSMCTHTHS